MTKRQVLVDSGATDNFICNKLLKRLKIGNLKLKTPIGLLTGAPAGIPGPDLQVIWIPKLIPGPVKIPVHRYLYLQVK